MSFDTTAKKPGESATAASTFAPATQDEAPLFDLAEAMQVVEGDRQLLSQMAWSFCEHAAQLLQQLPHAVARRDFNAVLLTAHTMKGSVRNFAARPAEAASMRLEQAAKAGEWHEVESTIVQFRAEISRLIPALAKLAEGEA